MTHSNSAFTAPSLKEFSASAPSRFTRIISKGLFSILSSYFFLWSFHTVRQSLLHLFWKHSRDTNNGEKHGFQSFLVIIPYDPFLHQMVDHKNLLLCHFLCEEPVLRGALPTPPHHTAPCRKDWPKNVPFHSRLTFLPFHLDFDNWKSITWKILSIPTPSYGVLLEILSSNTHLPPLSTNKQLPFICV